MSARAEEHPDAEDRTIAAIEPMAATGEAPSLIAGRYELRDSIGRGAFGEVFEALDRVLGRLVAVKLVPVSPNAGPEGRESLRRFQVEAQAVSRLTHPNIITVHDFGQGEHFAWIVMELVIGETLADALRRTGPPPPAETARVLCALLSALHAAHERGIVHRDVKPGNILLEMTIEEGLGLVRLSDFGIARTDAEERTVVGQMIGTPWVMAPEQLRGEAVDRRTDLWAAGVILYEMLTGERPFKGTMPGIFHRIQTEHPRPPSSIRAGLPPAFDAIVARALAKAPEDRFATAEEMAEALRDALIEAPPREDLPPLPGLDAEAEETRPPARQQAPASTPRRGYFLHGLALGALGGLVIGVAATRLVGLSPDNAALRAEPAAPLPTTASASQEAAADTPAIGDSAPPREAAAEQVVLRPVQDPAPEAAAEPVALASNPPPMQLAPEPEAPGGAMAPEQPMTVAATEPADKPGTASPTQGSLTVTPPAPAAPASVPAPAEEQAVLPVVAPARTAPPAPATRRAAPPQGAAAAAATTPGTLAPCGPDRLRIRTGSHDGHGRIVFDWSGPVAYRLTPDAAGLGIAFPDAGCRPTVEGVRPARNLAGAEPQGTGTEVLLRLRPGTQPHDFRLGNRVVIDLRDPPG